MGHETIVGGAIAAESSAQVRKLSGSDRGAAVVNALQGNLRSWLVVFSVGLMLFLGWQQRDYRYITAESGWGYALGIIGGSLMLALLLYPLRKRLRLMSRMGPVRIWFQMHMLFGVVGPAMILLHSNFRTGSVNSSVALYSMLLVAASGVIGRYIYTRTHYGMLGHKQALQALQAERSQHLRALTPLLEQSQTVRESFKRLQNRLIPEDQGLLKAFLCVVTLGSEARKTRRFARRELRKMLRYVARERSWSWSRRRVFRRRLNQEVRMYIATVVKVAEFDFYERLMSLWHTLHMPLFILLILTGSFHVVAVHMF